LSIAVNLSPRQISEGMAQMVQDCLTRAGLEPSALELEITEGLLMMDSEAVMPTLTSLTRTGVRISVDDFGTGYSSLSYLKRFPLHKRKIDAPLRKPSQNARKGLLLRAIARPRQGPSRSSAVRSAAPGAARPPSRSVVSRRQAGRGPW